jgi:anti-sigma factor RsiW
MHTPADSSLLFSPDDPRLSEWIDGRLAPTEAAAVERAVSSSPTLARLVADLRAVKAAARQATAASPPPGFTGRVMAAVVADKPARGDVATDSSDRLIEAEWRVIEAERIAEERAEAAADLEEHIAPVREPERPTWPWLTVATALAAGLLVTVVLNFPPRGPDEVQVAFVTEREAEPVAQIGELRKLAEHETAAALAHAAVAPRELQRATEKSRSRDKAAEREEPIDVMVRGPEGRAKLFERFAVLGLTALPDGAEVLELVGPEEAVAAFLADPLELVAGEDHVGGDRAPTAPPRRILIRVVELPAVAGELSDP